jgi:hypothetical protein
MRKSKDKRMKQTKRIISVRDLLQHSSVPPDARPLYANHAKLIVSDTELYIDFILLSPSIIGEEPVAEHVQRMIFPVAHAENLLKALETVVNAIAENDHDEDKTDE